MTKKCPPDQFWKLYEKLPQELKDALFSLETGENVSNICDKYGVEEGLREVVELVGQVLIGVLTPEDFSEALEKELKLERETARKVSQEINRFIFYPVKPALEELYKIEISPSEKSKKEMELKEEAPKVPSEKDIYREPLE